MANRRAGAFQSAPWTRRLHEPGWLILPLRAFLGITFSYAGLQKLANPDYLDPAKPTSVVGQMRALQHASPIGPLLGLSVHAPTLVGLLIAFGELSVGLGTLAGLCTRVAAGGGALLALTFFLTVSWNTAPYYYGADIVFVFAWTVLLGFGAGGVLSLDAWLRNRARQRLRLPPEPAVVPVFATRLRALCPRGRVCGLRPDGTCSRLRGCPIFPVEEPLAARTRAEVDRRTVLNTGTAAALAAAGVLAIGGITAALGRLAGGTRRPNAALPALPGVVSPTGTPSTTPSSSGVPASPNGSASVAGTAIGPASAIPVGQARSFTDPASGNPAWVVHPSGNSFVAFSAVCTHAGCPVQYDSSTMHFDCPCHGGVYDARTGQVLQGPPPSPLPQITVRVVAGQLRVDG